MIPQYTLLLFYHYNIFKIIFILLFIVVTEDIPEKRNGEANTLQSKYLCSDMNDQQETYITYDKYRHRFDNLSVSFVCYMCAICVLCGKI